MRSLHTGMPQSHRRGWRAGLARVALALVLALAIAPFAATQAQGAPLLANDGAATPQPHVTILVLDMSGSMSGNDPDGLRCSAANAFISLSAPGQYIGVVGLTDRSGSGQAEIWAQPAEMATLTARNQLINTINDKSHHCEPNGDTPTEDALTKALAMLESSTSGRAGSVILLTDGIPAPNTTQQQDDIEQKWVPQFAQHQWRIDSMALGADQSTRAFLHAVSSGTGGADYDDVNPTTGRPDPLQIAPFFLQVFASLTQRTPKTLIDQQSLTPPLTQRDFIVSNFVTHLDAVVIKQDASATVALQSPEGIQFTQSGPGVLVALDPHYAIFSIDNPTPGDWIVNIHGGSSSRQFSVFGLVVTNLSVSLTQPGATQQHFPIDQPLNLQAQLSSGGARITGGHYTVIATLASGNTVVDRAPLAPANGASAYTGTITVPNGQAAGSFVLTITVTQGSGDVLASTQRAIGFEIFPTPYLLDGSGAQVTSVSATAVSFDGVMQTLYSLPVVSWFSGPPLQNIPARTSGVVSGVVVHDNKLYANATVTGSATRAGSTTHVPVQVANTGPGQFVADFSAPANGNYTLTLLTSGTYADSHGAFGPTQRSVLLTVRPATQQQELRAWLVTMLYLVLLICISPLIYRWIPPRPSGSWSVTGGGAATTARRNGDFNHYRVRNLTRWWFFPHTRTSREVWGIPGVVLRWRRAGVQAHPDGRGSSAWGIGNATHLDRGWQRVGGSKLKYTLRNLQYTIEAPEARRRGAGGRGSNRGSGRAAAQSGRAASDWTKTRSSTAQATRRGWTGRANSQAGNGGARRSGAPAGGRGQNPPPRRNNWTNR